MPKLPPLESFDLLGYPRDLHLLVHYLDFQSSLDDSHFDGFLYHYARNLERSLKDAQDPSCFSLDQECSRLDFNRWLDGRRIFEE